MEPNAISLDIFQREKNCFLGVVLPTLLIMSDKIEKISHLKHCQYLKETILNNFKIRFSYIIDLEKESSKIFIISAISIQSLNCLGYPMNTLMFVKAYF